MANFIIETETIKTIKTKVLNFTLNEGQTLKDNEGVMNLANFTVPAGKKIDVKLILIVLNIEDI